MTILDKSGDVASRGFGIIDTEAKQSPQEQTDTCQVRYLEAALAGSENSQVAQAKQLEAKTATAGSHARSTSNASTPALVHPLYSALPDATRREMVRLSAARQQMDDDWEAAYARRLAQKRVKGK